MKQTVLIFLIGFGLVACKPTDKKIQSGPELNVDSIKAVAMKDTANYTTIQWLDSTYVDLGRQKEGKEIEISFRFKNTGTKNLVIESVSAQCGCTVPEQHEKPYAPGEEGLIKAKYNGSGHGETRKEVYVNLNANPNRQTLTFRAEMIK
jgi:hypothetical protein